MVRAQYAAGGSAAERVPGYLQEEGIAPDSRTETFVALKAVYRQLAMGRSAVLPAHWQAHAAARERHLRAVQATYPRSCSIARVSLPPDVLAMRIQPDEGFSLEVLAKRPGLDLAIQPVRMDLRYPASSTATSPEAYERLLLDVMAGDHTLFLSSRFVQRSWEFVQGILDQWQADPTLPLEPYAAGTWGPKAADDLIRADGREWYEP